MVLESLIAFVFEKNRILCGAHSGRRYLLNAAVGLDKAVS